MLLAGACGNLGHLTKPPGQAVSSQTVRFYGKTMQRRYGGLVGCFKQKKPGRTPGSSAEDVKRANHSAARHVGTIAASVTGANTIQRGKASDTQMLKVRA